MLAGSNLNVAVNLNQFAFSPGEDDVIAGVAAAVLGHELAGHPVASATLAIQDIVVLPHNHVISVEDLGPRTQFHIYKIVKQK